jgi:uncharacterized protein YcbK (DUF882 family)
MNPEFKKLLTAHGVRFFSADELFYRGDSNGRLNLNTDPPKNLWKNIFPTVVIADQAREIYGHPIRINSAYRSPKYNKAVGGSSASTHMQFQALDLGCKEPHRLYTILIELRRAGLFKGGIGIYHSFVHLDTRGHNATWRG